jgi:hypothetical protein
MGHGEVLAGHAHEIKGDGTGPRLATLTRNTTKRSFERHAEFVELPRIGIEHEAA